MFHPQGPTFCELARQALSSTRRGYDLLAPKFEYTPYRTPDGLIELALEGVAAAGPVHRALDLCCGTGAALRRLAPIARELVCGVDFSSGMLAEARRAPGVGAGTAGPGRARTELVQGDARRLPFGRCFDLAVCFGGIGHFVGRDQEVLFSEVARILRPGGLFVFPTSTLPSPREARWWRARLFNAAMHLRNLLRPPFVMYYLKLPWPEVRPRLERHGFDVEAAQLGGPLRLVTARRVDRPGSGGAPIARGDRG